MARKVVKIYCWRKHSFLSCRETKNTQKMVHFWEKFMRTRIRIISNNPTESASVSPGSFPVFWGRGWGWPLKNFAFIKGMTMRLEDGWYVQRCFIWASKRTLWRLGQNFKLAAILDPSSFLISPKPHKTTKIEPVVIKMKGKTQKWYNNMKFTVSKLNFIY